MRGFPIRFLSIFLFAFVNTATADVPFAPCVLGDILEERGAYYLVDEGPDGFLCRNLPGNEVHGLPPNPNCASLCHGQKEKPRPEVVENDPKPVFEPYNPADEHPVYEIREEFDEE